MARARNPSGRPQVIDHAEITRVYIDAVVRGQPPVKVCQRTFALNYERMSKRAEELRTRGWLPRGQVPLRADDPARDSWVAEARRLLESQVARRRAIEVARRQLLAEREEAAQQRRVQAAEQRRQNLATRAQARDQVLTQQVEVRAQRKAARHQAYVDRMRAAQPERLAKLRAKHNLRRQLYTQVEQPAPSSVPLLDEFLGPAWFS